MKILLVVLLVGLPGVAAAQAAVEAAAGMSRSAAGAAAAGQAAGKGIGGALDKLNRNLDGAGQSKSETPRPAARQTPASSSKVQPAPAKKVDEPQYESPAGIQEGMELAELSRRFGPPSLKIVTGADQETYCYMGK